MPLFGGGSAQSTNSIVSNLDFMPTFNIGDNNTVDTRKSQDQSATATPKLDESFGAAASVGVAGGSGGPATFTRTQEEPLTLDSQKSDNSNLFNEGMDTKPLYILGGLGVGFMAFIYYFNEKNKKSK